MTAEPTSEQRAEARKLIDGTGDAKAYEFTLANVAALIAERDRLRAENEAMRPVVELASHAWEYLNEIYRQQDEERSSPSGLGSGPRDSFESYIDDLATRAAEAVVRKEEPSDASNQPK